MDYVFEKSMQEIEEMLMVSRHSENHFSKDNHIFTRLKEIVYSNGLEASVGYLLHRYVMVMHREWIQASFSDKTNQSRQHDVRGMLRGMVNAHCEDNGLSDTVLTHLLCLHEAVWHSMLSQLQDYCVKRAYIESGYTKFKSRFNPKN